MTESRTSGIPLTVAGGFLGAGRTRLLNRLLRDVDRRSAAPVHDATMARLGLRGGR